MCRRLRIYSIGWGFKFFYGLCSFIMFSNNLGLALRSVASTRVVNSYNGAEMDFYDILKDSSKKLVIYGTYAADFNAIEYIQRLRYYMPQLKDKGIESSYLILNAKPSAALKLANELDLSTEVVVLSDELGYCGQEFGCARGWRSEDNEMNPYLKLFGMLWGLGAWATLPSVIGGYIGNPFSPQPWIETALAQGQRKGRWPNTALELDEQGSIKVNKFQELPLVGGWKRRPLELATLRLQNMIGISLKYWNELKPSENALKRGVLTQLGGCAVYGPGGKVLYEWRDEGICHVCKFEDIIEKV